MKAIQADHEQSTKSRDKKKRNKRKNKKNKNSNNNNKSKKRQADEGKPEKKDKSEKNENDSTTSRGDIDNNNDNDGDEAIKPEPFCITGRMRAVPTSHTISAVSAFLQEQKATLLDCQSVMAEQGAIRELKVIDCVRKRQALAFQFLKHGMPLILQQCQVVTANVASAFHDISNTIERLLESLNDGTIPAPERASLFDTIRRYIPEADILDVKEMDTAKLLRVAFVAFLRALPWWVLAMPPTRGASWKVQYERIASIQACIRQCIDDQLLPDGYLQLHGHDVDHKKQSKMSQEEYKREISQFLTKLFPTSSVKILQARAQLLEERKKKPKESKADSKDRWNKALAAFRQACITKQTNEDSGTHFDIKVNCQGDEKAARQVVDLSSLWPEGVATVEIDLHMSVCHDWTASREDSAHGRRRQRKNKQSSTSTETRQTYTVRVDVPTELQALLQKAVPPDDGIIVHGTVFARSLTSPTISSFFTSLLQACDTSNQEKHSLLDHTRQDDEDIESGRVALLKSCRLSNCYVAANMSLLHRRETLASQNKRAEKNETHSFRTLQLQRAHSLNPALLYWNEIGPFHFNSCSPDVYFSLLTCEAWSGIKSRLKKQVPKVNLGRAFQETKHQYTNLEFPLARTDITGLVVAVQEPATDSTLRLELIQPDLINDSKRMESIWVVGLLGKVVTIVPDDIDNGQDRDWKQGRPHRTNVSRLLLFQSPQRVDVRAQHQISLGLSYVRGRMVLLDQHSKPKKMGDASFLCKCSDCQCNQEKDPPQISQTRFTISC
jgi:hypothetical protein